MTSSKELDILINLLPKERTVLFSCTAGYPTPFNTVHLLNIKDLLSLGFKEIGFSGHHKGIAIDNAAVALGATWVERHFTLDRTWKGTDQSASLEAGGMSKLVRVLSLSFESLNYKLLV